MLHQSKKDWLDIFNSSLVKMSTCSVASIFNQEKKKKILHFSYLEAYPNQSIDFESSGMKTLV